MAREAEQLPVLGNSHDHAERDAQRASRRFGTSLRSAIRHASPPCACSPREPRAPAIVGRVLSQPGAPLDDALRREAESWFAHRFADVRVHTDGQAAESARAIGAHAYTVGPRIVFDRDAFDPARPNGRSTLAHELMHVVQGDPRVLRRQGTPPAATVELCFVPIGRFQLGRVGGVHAVLNVQGARGAMRTEVDPAQHQGVEDPAAATAGPGRAAGLHSHVVIQPGSRTGGTCQTLTATPAQADAVIDAARRYESLDVVYEAPGLGPNSNSFAEWALHEAGISTSGIAVPDGALAWGWYQSNSAARASPPRVARTFAGTAALCTTQGSRAASFQALVDLFRRAETQLIACGVTDVGERVTILRGIWYGTPWSRDFGSSERSHIRTQMFNVYSGTAQPRNPLECIDCGTFLDLGRSQDVTDPSGRHVDVGHMLIGMDARRSLIARTVAQPVGQVTGLEAATWAGDLGGGAARVALRRVTDSTVRATQYFRGSDYGGSINLEGDVAGYAVGAAGASPGSAPALSIAAGSTIADTLADYFFGISGAPAGWNNRCRTFIAAMGGTFNAAGALTNRADVLAYLTEQIHDFGCWYMVNYQRQHAGMNAATLETASRHLGGASAETAEVFLAALERCVANPSARLAASGTGPAPSPIGSPSCGLARAVPETGRAIEETRRRVEEKVIPEARRMVDEADRWIQERQREAQRWWQQVW